MIDEITLKNKKTKKQNIKIFSYFLFITSYLLIIPIGARSSKIKRGRKYYLCSIFLLNQGLTQIERGRSEARTDSSKLSSLHYTTNLNAQSHICNIHTHCITHNRMHICCVYKLGCTNWV